MMSRAAAPFAAASTLIAEIAQNLDGVEPKRVIIFDDEDAFGADRPGVAA